MRFGRNASIMYLITWLKAQSKGFAMLRNDSPKVAFLAQDWALSLSWLIDEERLELLGDTLRSPRSFSYNKYFNLFKE